MKRLINIIILILTPIHLFAHSLVLNILDNNDDTMTVEGSFNTGESASGALVKIESIDSGETLFQERLSDNRELVIEIPKIPYKVILDGGPGHMVEKIGIAPKSGFEKVEKKVKKSQIKKDEKTSRSNIQISTSPAVTTSIILAFILLFATIIVSIKNTNKILEKLKE